MTTFLAHGDGGMCRRTASSDAHDGGAPVPLSGTVGKNALNRFEDVRTVQDALNQVPPLEGGPSVKLKVDGLCWGKTVAAIERFQREACGFKWPDGRVDPGGKTHVRLEDFYLYPSPYTLQSIHSQLAEAGVWIFRARTAIYAAQESLESGAYSPGRLLLDKYFHLDQLPSKPKIAAALQFIDRIYATMQEALRASFPGAPEGACYFVEDSKNNLSFAYTYEGGFFTGPVLSRTGGGYTKGPNQRIDRIYICPRKLSAHPREVYCIVIVHELAHFCGRPLGHADAIVDHSYRRKPDFYQLSPEKALRTADCYAHFAGHLVMNREPLHPG